MGKENDKMHRYTEMYLQTNGIGPAHGGRGRALLVMGGGRGWGLAWPRLGSEVFGKGDSSLWVTWH